MTVSAPPRLRPNEIHVLDGIVPRELQLRLAALLARPIWRYGWRSNRGDRQCYWHAHFAGGDERSRASCEAELARNPHCAAVGELWRLLKGGHLAGHEPLRVYANSHTFGTEGRVHVDSADARNYFSTVYYAHLLWRRDWAGDIVFYARGGEEIVASVYPKPGRLVTFPGNVPHCARAPSRECVALRVSIVIKTQLPSAHA